MVPAFLLVLTLLHPGLAFAGAPAPGEASAKPTPGDVHSPRYRVQPRPLGWEAEPYPGQRCWDLGREMVPQTGQGEAVEQFARHRSVAFSGTVKKGAYKRRAIQPLTLETIASERTIEGVLRTLPGTQTRFQDVWTVYLDGAQLQDRAPRPWVMPAFANVPGARPQGPLRP